MDVEETGIDSNGRFTLSDAPPELPLTARKVTAGHELIKTVPLLNNTMVKWKCSCGAEGMGDPESTGQAYQDHLPDMPRVVKPESPVRPDKPQEPEISQQILTVFSFTDKDHLYVSSGSKISGDHRVRLSEVTVWKPLERRGNTVYYPERKRPTMVVVLANVKHYWEDYYNTISHSDAMEQIRLGREEEARWSRLKYPRDIY